MKGVIGKILIVNLTEGIIHEEFPPEEIYRNYLGGYGLGVWYLYNHIEPGCDPLGPGNILGFTPGLFSGSGAGFSGRYMVVGKSPLTGKGKRSNGEYCNGGWGNANSGGLFSPAIKRAGYDAIFFHGKAEKPVYLLIKNDKVSLEDASDLWGVDSVETEEELKRKHGTGCHIACIGPGAEKLSLISGICNDKGRLAARSGLGAVMGSKKLKALCLDGNFRVEFNDRELLSKINQEFYSTVLKYRNIKLINKSADKFDYFAPMMRILRMGMTAAPSSALGPMLGGMYGGAGLGTGSQNVISAQIADSPVKNYSGNAVDDYPWKRAMKLRGKNFKDFGIQQYGCFSCPLKCGYILKYDKLPYENKETHRPEYETSAAFGPLILNDNIELVIQVNEYLNRIGVDTISGGATVAYVLEMVKRGMLKKEDFVCTEYPEGFLPRFDDHTYLLPLVRLIFSREGIGDKFADGTYVAAQHFPGTKEFAINVNGSEMGMHDCRAGKAWGMSYVSDPTPGRHTAGNYDTTALGMTEFYPPMAPFFKKTDDPYQQGRASTVGIKVHQVMESLGLCMFSYFFGDYHMHELFKAITGWDMTADELLSAGERIQAMRQMFNAREGAIRHEMPQRAIGSPPLKNGSIKGVTIDPEIMIQGYYHGMGYRQDGVPTEDTLRRLGLDNIVPDLAICTGAPDRLINEYMNSPEYLNSKEVKKKQSKEKHKPRLGG